MKTSQWKYLREAVGKTLGAGFVLALRVPGLVFGREVAPSRVK